MIPQNNISTAVLESKHLVHVVQIIKYLLFIDDDFDHHKPDVFCMSFGFTRILIYRVLKMYKYINECICHVTQDVTVGLNAASSMVTSFELSVNDNDPSIEQDSEYEHGEDEIGYDKSDVPEEYAEEYSEGQYEGQETELTEDQIGYGEDQGEEDNYNDEVLDLEINEPLDEFPDEEFLQSYSEQQVIKQAYEAEEELEEVADTQTPPNESEEAVIENLEFQEETKEESDEEEEDDEESGRLRFKTERKEGTIIRLSDVTRERRNIPETLVVCYPSHLEVTRQFTIIKP
uniref:Uncharacterized protein n=1 Tax=Naja naja TaxID=35670 RepID=A0A8C6XJE3_NAJNA